MLWSPKLSLSYIHVRLTAKGLLRSLQLLSGCRKNTVVFHAVDKNRAKAPGPRNQQQQPAPPQPPPGRGHVERPGSATENLRAQAEQQSQDLQHLRELLVGSQRQFEAVTVVLQRTLAERDEAVKRRRELSQEMVTLRGELASSALCCERVEREKMEVRAAMDEALREVRERHTTDLAQLEERLQSFYQTEWDKVHLTYQEEADRCKAHLEQQMGELRAHQEALRLELETKHGQQLECVKEQCEGSLEETREAHKQQLQTLDKDAEATQAEIQKLAEENAALSQRLKEEEDRRRELADKNQMDSHTLYLEQELQSLKVVLDIKNKQLHQQNKKLMQTDKLIEKCAKLEEGHTLAQQENEDLRARMDRHSALSRQLSAEQSVLQESLHKESKVNKRLSMENEELYWKLHNGDLASPRRSSPVSPSRALGLQSPHSSAVFSPTTSPR